MILGPVFVAAKTVADDHGSEHTQDQHTLLLKSTNHCNSRQTSRNCM